jgi:hypothetical protein
LAASLSLPATTRRFHEAVRFEVAAQLAEQGGVFGKLFHQDLAGAVEHALDVGEAGFGVEVAFGFDFRGQQSGRQQGFGERCETGFAGDLAPCCAASACTAGRGLRGAAWCRRR